MKILYYESVKDSIITLSEENDFYFVYANKAIIYFSLSLQRAQNVFKKIIEVNKNGF